MLAEKLPFEASPEDDRRLPDVHLALYNNVVIFDSVAKMAYIMCWVHKDNFNTLEEAYVDGCENLERLSKRITNMAPMLTGSVDMSLSQRPPTAVSNMTQEEFMTVGQILHPHTAPGHASALLKFTVSQKLKI